MRLRFYHFFRLLPALLAAQTGFCTDDQEIKAFMAPLWLDANQTDAVELNGAGHAVLRCRDQRDAFEEQKKRATPTAVKQREESQVVASSHRLMGDALGQNLIGIFLKQPFDQGQSFLPRAFGLVGQGDLSQYSDYRIGSVCMRHLVLHKRFQISSGPTLASLAWKDALTRLNRADLGAIKKVFANYPYPDLLRAIEVSIEALEEADRERYLDLAVFPEVRLQHGRQVKQV